jgi:hypothetical protein
MRTIGPILVCCLTLHLRLPPLIRALFRADYHPSLAASGYSKHDEARRHYERAYFCLTCERVAG